MSRIFDAGFERPDALAVIDESGEHTYEWLMRRARVRASQLLGDRDDLAEARVAFLMPDPTDAAISSCRLDISANCPFIRSRVNSTSRSSSADKPSGLPPFTSHLPGPD